MNATALYRSIAHVLLMLVAGTFLLAGAVVVAGSATQHSSSVTQTVAGRCTGCN